MKRLVFVVLLVALFLRLINLNSVPPGIANDELNIVMNAQSLLKTGVNIPGVVTGIIGKTSGDLSMGIHSEISSYLIVPFIALFGFNSVAIKIPFVLASLGIVIVGYFLSKRLFDQKTALITLTILAVNPWLLFFGRSAYESILSSFFYLLSILLIINLSGWKKLYSLLPLVAGFLCYFSAKTLILPVAVIASFSSIILNKDHNYKPIAVLNGLVLAFVVSYLLILPKTPAGARINELKSSELSRIVNLKRTAGIESLLALPFENKIIEDLRIRIPAALGGLNPTYLFFNGQPESIPSLSVPDHAFIYLVDLPLIILGIIFMAGKFKKQLAILSGFIVITLIPNFLNLQGTTYSIRTVILFPILAIMSAVGICSLRNRLLRIITVLIYLIFVLNFSYIYFNRLPVEKAEGWFLSQRVLAKYISETISVNPGNKIILVTKEPKLAFYRYLLYSGKYTDPKEINLLNSKMTREDYEIGNLKITDMCSKDVTIMSTTSDCPKAKGNTIKSIYDAGDMYVLSNDELCKEYTKNQYPLIKDIKTLVVEKLSTEDFCKNYISI